MKHARLILIAVLALALVSMPVLAAQLFGVDDANTVALLHLDGADGSTTITDESGKGWTAAGNAQIDTAQSVFGGASGLFDGNGDYVHTPDHDAWWLDGGSNSNTWTIDFRVRFNGDPGTGAQGFVSQRVDQNNNWALRLTNNNFFFTYTAAGSLVINTGMSWNPADATWYHIAVVKNGTTGYMFFVDGTQVGATATDTDPLSDLAGELEVGRYQNSAGTLFYLNGWIDELRISKGVARWTSNFTPPDAPYPDAAATATAQYYQTQTAQALTATAQYYQTQTAAALTATYEAQQTETAAANFQTQTAAALTATHEAQQTATALALTQTAQASITPGTPVPFGTPAYDSTISYGDMARLNVMACMGVIGFLWLVIWLAGWLKARRQQ